MSQICALDEDNCLTLDSISRAFHCAIKEEQSWALIYQSILSLKEDLIQNNEKTTFVESTNLFIRNNGTIHSKSWHSSSQQNKCVPIKKVLSSIGTVIYKALDYGIGEDEEVIIPSLLEEVFIEMTRDLDDIDEGIDEDFDPHKDLEPLINKCKIHIIDNTDIGEHYRNVCRALVIEAIEMSTFLNQISIGTRGLNKIKNVDNEEVEVIHVQLWAHIWMKVMRQLRVGVSLKTVDKQELIGRQQREYELTPFEMLLDDISSKRYSLKKVISLPKQVEKDARTVILEFVRSRPPLRPASQRELKPLPRFEACLHEKLIEGIKHPPKLRQTQTFERKFDSFHLPRGKRYSLNTNTNKSNNNIQTNESANVFQRFSFRNLSLRSASLISNTLIGINGPNPITPTPSSRRRSFWDKLRLW